MINEISVSRVTECVARLCVGANLYLPEDVQNALSRAKVAEKAPLAKDILQSISENLAAADALHIPICQDTGMAVVFLEIGQDVHFVDGDLEQAVNEGVRQGYLNGLLRLSVIGDPLQRVNTGDNTPAILHTKIVPGDAVKITVAPKGFGSENMSGVRMLTPAAGRAGVVAAVLDVVKQAGSNPCPPMVIGVGIGGDFEQCALLAKQALCRSLDIKNPNTYYAQLEEELTQSVNALGIGPQGFGGVTTCLGVNVEYAPTHIAGLPVAVNIGCHVTRHKTEILR